MGKFLFKRLSLIFMLVILLAFTGCKSQEDSLLLKQKQIYNEAVESGFVGTFEEWLDLITGVNLNSIKEVSLNEKGELLITYTNGEVINLGLVKGEDGLGIYDVRVDSDGSLIITYTNGSFKNLGKIEQKEQTGIVDVSVGSDGSLVVTYSDGSTKNLGGFSGGESSILGVSDIYINTSGNLIVVLSDGTTKDIGKIGLGKDESDGVVPVYQGMSVTSSSANIEQQNAKRSNSFKESVDDYLDIITTERVEYYASKNETFSICIHLYNPSAYEILSFTLNGYKYQAYEFKEGSTSTKLIVDVKAPNVSGINEYTIDSVKYVDGVQIKDAQMDGEKTVKVGVKYDILPTSSTFKESVTSTTFKTNVEIFDLSGILEDKGLHFFVFDGANIVSHQELKLGINEVVVTELLMGVTYDYMIVGVYDDLSGKGKHAGVLNEGKFTTLGGYNLSKVETSKDEISINLDCFDENASIDKIELYHQGKVIEQKEFASDIVFSNLLSDNEYEIVITYSYYKDGVVRTGRINEIVKTKEKTVPSYTLNKQVASTSRIDYAIEEVDIDNVKLSFKATLFEGSVKVGESTSLSGSFTNLNSNTLYKIVYEYTYDLNDGGGLLKLVSEMYVETKEKAIPSIDLTYTKDTNSLSYVANLNDLEGVLTSITYKLYQGMVLVGQTNENSFTFSNLSSNTLYTLEVIYKYDLNDGEEEITKVNRYDITLSKEVPTIELTPYLVTKNSVEYNVLIKDSNAVGRVNMVALYVDNTFLKRIDETTSVINDLSSNTTYNIRINYVYDLDDGLGSKEINYKYEFTTLKEDASATLNLVSSTTSSLDLLIERNDLDKALTFVRVDVLKDGYVVKTTSDLKDLSFNNLLSDTLYEVVAIFTKDLNNGEVVYTARGNFKTLSMPKPTVSFNLSATTSSIKYSYTLVDPNSISEVKDISLYYNGVLVNNTPSNFTFSNLYSNQTYEVRLTLLVDYCNGLEKVEEVYQEEISTLEYNNPSVNLTLTSKVDRVNYVLEINDPNNLIKSTNVSLYKDNIHISTYENNLNSSFINLLSNTLYEVRVEYVYDLNDNIGLKTSNLSKSYLTLAHDVEVIDYELLNDTLPKTNELINIKVNVNNISKIKIDYFIINNERFDVVGGDYENYVIVNITTPRMSGLFNIDITKAGYVINDYLIEQDIKDDLDIMVNVVSRMDIVSVETPNSSGIYNLNYSNGCIFTIDNPNGYVITELYGYNTGVVMIDDYHFYMDYPMQDSFYITGFEYIDEYGDVASRLYEDMIYSSSRGVSGDSNTNAIETHIITTPEQLLNIKDNYYYELGCDIDMSGYLWEPTYFTGTLNGKGYKIKNLTLIKSNEYNHTSIGLFSSSDFILENVFFENIYFSISSKNISTYILFDIVQNDIFPTVNNVLFSGNINLIAEEYCELNSISGNNIYGVDEFNLNGETITYYPLKTEKEVNDEAFKKDVLGWDFTLKEYQNYEGFMYTSINNSYIIINGYNGEDSNLVIPDMINGLKVIGVEDLSFEDNLVITKVVFPSTLLYVGTSCLKGCSNLEEVVIEDVKSFKNDNIMRVLFGEEEYGNSYHANSAYIPNNLKNFTIKGNIPRPSVFIGVKSLETVVYGCPGSIDGFRESNIRRVELLEGVTDINGCAFYSCEKLEEIILPSSLTYIGDQAFTLCTSLKTIDLPSQLTNLGGYAFMYCYSLEELIIPNSIKVIPTQLCFYCEGLTNVVLHDDITEIHSAAFEGCKSLESFTFPSKIERVENSLLNQCISIEVIDIPNTVTYIGSNAFGAMSSLKEVTISTNVETISSFAFFSCQMLRSVEIPSSVKTIEECAFLDNATLRKVILNEGLEVIGNQAFSNCTKLIEINLPSTVTKIGDSAFQSCYELQNITIPKSVTKIGKATFSDCFAFTEIIIPEGVTSIGQYAFRNCANLTNVVLPSTLEEINHEAFIGLVYIESIVIPTSVEYMGYSVFNNCNSLTIYCKHPSLPSKWDEYWNISNLNVVWGY